MVRISLVDDMRRKTVVISVADNGGGIPEPALERIFDPFFTTKKEGQGTGLGLSVSYSIIDAMGGRLEAQNADGGAEFRISVPAAADVPEEVMEEMEEMTRQERCRHAVVAAMVAGQEVKSGIAAADDDEVGA